MVDVGALDGGRVGNVAEAVKHPPVRLALERPHAKPLVLVEVLAGSIAAALTCALSRCLQSWALRMGHFSKEACTLLTAALPFLPAGISSLARLRAQALIAGSIWMA